MALDLGFLGGQRAYTAALHGEKFNVLISLNGSDRSSWLSFLSGARERLGRMPGNGGPLFWRQMFTAHVQHPFNQELVCLQRCRCLEKAGFPFTPPEFHVEIAPAHLAATGLQVFLGNKKPGQAYLSRFVINGCILEL